MFFGLPASIAAWLDSFWLSEAAPTLRSRPLAAPADVEIVGGGITGVSAALTLARRGKRVRAA